MIHGFPWPMWVCITATPTIGVVALIIAIIRDRRDR